MSRSKNKNPGRAQKHWFLKASSGNLRCRWPDSNRHGVNRLILSQVRLPIPPQRLNAVFAKTTYDYTIKKYAMQQLFFYQFLPDIKAVERGKIVRRCLRSPDHLYAAVLFQK